MSGAPATIAPGAALTLRPETTLLLGSPVAEYGGGDTIDVSFVGGVQYPFGD